MSVLTQAQIRAKQLSDLKAMPGWGLMVKEIEETKGSLLNQLLHGDIVTEEFRGRYSALDSILRWIDDAIEEGK